MDFQETTPEARLNHLIKEAGFTSIINIHETYYKCFSCHGIQNQWHLLTTHGKYMHSIFRVAHTSQIGKLKFFLLKTSYNETPINRLDTTYLPIFTTTNTVFVQWQPFEQPGKTQPSNYSIKFIPKFYFLYPSSTRKEFYLYYIRPILTKYFNVVHFFLFHPFTAILQP